MRFWTIPATVIVCLLLFASAATAQDASPVDPLAAFEAALAAETLTGEDGAVARYEALRGQISEQQFAELGERLAVALEASVDAYVEEVSGGGDNAPSLLSLPADEVATAAEAAAAALALRGATYSRYPVIQQQRTLLQGLDALLNRDFEGAQAQLAQIDPPTAYSLNALGYSWYRIGEMDDAHAALAEAVQLAPDWSEPRRLQGFVAQFQHEWEDALKYYGEAAELDPDDARIQVDIGEVEAQSGDLDAAMSAWRKALEMDAENSAATIVGFIRERYLAADREELAESIYAEAIMRRPDSAVLYVDRGDFYLSLDRFDDAEADYRQALKLDSGNVHAENGLGLVYEFQDRYDEAARAYRRTAELAPDDPVPYRNLGDVYYAQQRYDDAIAAYEQALQNDPDYYPAHHGLGNVYIELEDFDTAERHLTTYAEQSNDNTAWNSLGVFYETNLRQYEDALRAYERARDIEPDALILANLGDARRKLGRYYEAAGAYTDSLRMDPSQPLALQGLDMLEDHGVVPRRDRRVSSFSGRLETGGDTLDDGTLYSQHTLYGAAGEEWIILLRSDAFDPFLLVWDDSGGGAELARDDDSGGGTNASVQVTLPRTGNYTIVANTYGEGQYGDYEIVLLRARPENADSGDQQVFNGALTAASDTLDDDSRFEVHVIDAEAGEDLEVTAASSAFDAMVYVLGPDGNLIAQDDDSAGGTNARLTLTIPTTGEYSLVVNSYGPDALGDYTLTVRRSGAVAAAPGGTDGGEIFEGELSRANDTMDDGSRYALHSVSALEGETLDILLTSADFDAYLLLLDENGTKLAEDDDSGGNTNARIAWTAPADGTYTIVANSYDADAIGAYTVSVRRNDDALGTIFGGSLDDSEVVTGELTAAHETMDDGSRYAVHTLHASEGEQFDVTLSSPAFDVYLFVFDENGGKLAEDDDSAGGPQGTDARVHFTAPSDGEYFIIANGYDASSLGQYTLSVKRGPEVDQL